MLCAELRIHLSRRGIAHRGASCVRSRGMRFATAPADEASAAISPTASAMGSIPRKSGRRLPDRNGSARFQLGAPSYPNVDCASSIRRCDGMQTLYVLDNCAGGKKASALPMVSPMSLATFLGNALLGVA
jgi:hypothetical protein